jgi:hypothetical protein
MQLAPRALVGRLALVARVHAQSGAIHQYVERTGAANSGQRNLAQLARAATQRRVVGNRDVQLELLAQRPQHPLDLAQRKADHDAAPIEVRSCKHLNNRVEQDHRNIKRRIRPMLGFKSFWTARVVLGGIELVHMLRKGQVAPATGEMPLSAADTFYGLAAA